jgi:hypothetical protein
VVDISALGSRAALVGAIAVALEEAKSDVFGGSAAWPADTSA